MQLQKSLDDMRELFSSRMTAFEGASTTSQTMDSNLVEEYRAFKMFIWSAVEGLQAQMGLVHKSLEQLEMRSRSAVLLLHGVPEADAEDAAATVLRICQDKVGVQDISDRSLYACHRLGGSHRGGKRRPILIRFACQRTRDAVWANKKCLKGSGFTLSEFLTSARHAVFVEARRVYGVGRSWTSDGRIVVLGQDKTRYRVTTLDELRAIPPNAASVESHSTPKVGGADAFNAVSSGASNAHAGPTGAAAASAIRREPGPAAAAPTLRTRTQRQKSPSRLRK